MPTPIVLLRTVLALLFLSNVFGYALTTAMSGTLPDAIAEFNAEQSACQAWVHRTWLGTYFFYLVAIVGLWFTRSWARSLFTATTIVMLGIVALDGPSASSAIDSFLQVLTCTLEGVVLALVWLLSESRVLFPAGTAFPPAPVGNPPCRLPCRAVRWDDDARP